MGPRADYSRYAARKLIYRPFDGEKCVPVRFLRARNTCRYLIRIAAAN